MKVKDMMNKDVIFCSEDDETNEVASTMINNNIHQLVLEDGRMVVASDIFRSSPGQKVRSIARNFGHLDPLDNERDALVKVLSSGAQSLPVVEAGKVVGILGLSDIAASIDLPDPAEFMHGPVFSVSPGDSVSKAMEIMNDKNLSRVAVTENERIVGVLSDLDLLKMVAKGYSGKKPPVSVLMSPYDASDDTSTEEIIRKVREDGVFYFTRDRIPYAVVTLTDILSSVLLASEDVNVRLIGFENEMARQKLEGLGRKLMKIVKLDGIVAHAKKAGENYELRVRAYTNIGNFVFSTSCFDITSGIDEAVDAIEQRVKSKKEKIRDLRRKMYSEF